MNGAALISDMKEEPALRRVLGVLAPEERELLPGEYSLWEALTSLQADELLPFVPTDPPKMGGDSKRAAVPCPELSPS